MTDEKEGATQRKFFKRFAKLLVSNLVDLYPKREGVLGSVVDKVALLAQSKVRIVRLAATFAAMVLLKEVLTQQHEMQQYLKRSKTQPSLSSEFDELILNCSDLLSAQTQILSQEVLEQRVYDPQEVIRKLVLQQLSQFEPREMQLALRGGKIIEIVFESLRDQALSVKKTALAILDQNLNLLNKNSDAADLDELLSLFERQKLQLVRLTQP